MPRFEFESGTFLVVFIFISVRVENRVYLSRGV
jgi:hypothetical protein